MPRYNLKPAQRAEIMKTRETQPSLRPAEVEALAQKHGISRSYVRHLRLLHGQLNGLKSRVGRAPALREARKRELLILLLLQRELTDSAIRTHFGISKTAYHREKGLVLREPRPDMSTIDLSRLAQSIEGAT